MWLLANAVWHVVLWLISCDAVVTESNNVLILCGGFFTSLRFLNAFTIKKQCSARISPRWRNFTKWVRQVVDSLLVNELRWLAAGLFAPVHGEKHGGWRCQLCTADRCQNCQPCSVCVPAPSGKNSSVRTHRPSPNSEGTHTYTGKNI